MATNIDEILVLHHSHLDVGYTHSQPITWELQKEYISQALDWLEETAHLDELSRPKWTCEAYEPVLRWLERASQDDVARFVRLHNNGRIGVAALRWNASALPDRSGLERLVEGKKTLEAILGRPVPVACQHDVPGAQWALADVLIDAGVEMLVMGANVHSGRPLTPRPGMFRWEAPSGRSIRVFNGHHYTMFDQLLNSWDESVERMEEGWAELNAHLGQTGYSLPFVYLSSTCSPVMWDNAPPNPFLPDLIRSWNEKTDRPRIRYATFDDLLHAASVVPFEDLEVYRGDWTDYWTFGAGSTPVATALSRHAKARLVEADVVGTDRAEVLSRAQDANDLFDEHTWGFYDPSPTNPQAVTTEHLKKSLAHEANELAEFALMSGLEALAENPPADRGIINALIVNTADHARVVQPEVPKIWYQGDENERSYRARRMSFEGRPWRVGCEGDSIPLERIELPPRSWRVVALDGAQEEPAEGGVKHVTASQERAGVIGWDAYSETAKSSGIIETPFHRVGYDVETGRIKSLFDRGRDREILDGASEFDFFEFVRERTDQLVDGSREAFYKRDLDKEKFDVPGWVAWRPIYERAHRVIECRVEASPQRATLIRRLEAPGLSSLLQRFTFSQHSPVIEVEVEYELLPDTSPQGIYFATPLALSAGWVADFDSAGEVVRLDDDQLPTASKGWVTVESFASMGDEHGLYAFFTPDAPLVQFGDFGFGPALDEVPRPENPRMLAWSYNNYWMTNYPLTEPGVIRQRFGFGSYKPDAAEYVRREAHDFAHPVLVWPVTGQGRAVGSGRIDGV